MLCNYSFTLKLVAFSSIGLFLSGIGTYVTYKARLNTIRDSENLSLIKISTVLFNDLHNKLDKQFVSRFMSVLGGVTSRQGFEYISDPRLTLESTSIGWIPMVNSSYRDEFVLNNQNYFSEFDYIIKGIDQNMNIIERPIDNSTIWPILFTNPLTLKFTGFDIGYSWGVSIQEMIDTRSTVIIDLVPLLEFGGVGEFVSSNTDFTFDVSEEPFIFMIFQPVIDIMSDEIIGLVLEVIFPHGFILDALSILTSSESKDVNLTILRLKKNGKFETFFDFSRPFHDPLEDLTDEALSKGSNVYTDTFHVSDQYFNLIMTTTTKPEFVSYGSILLGGLLFVFVSTLMYVRQSITSLNNKKMATVYKNSTELKSAFLAEMSHELRTPLNGIIGTVEILLSLVSTDDIKGYVDDIKTCSSMLLTTVSEILDFSKIEAGKLTLDIEPMYVESFTMGILKIMVQSYNRIVPGERVKLYVDMDSNLPSSQLFGDHTKCRQVIMNLVSNAFKFTDSGSIYVHVSSEIIGKVENVYLGDGYGSIIAIDICVRDTGIGMDSDRKSQLFKPFTQVHTGRSSTIGTGLGLSITKSICDAMGGYVTCESHLGTGSILNSRVLFGTNVIPVPTIGYSCKSEWILGLPDVSPVVTRHTSFTDHKPLILVVDDMNMNRKVLTKYLEMIAVRSEIACNGAEAIEMCKIKKYAMIFMDYYMPDITGARATYSIKDEGMNKSTNIVGVTASTTGEIYADMIKSGMCECINKPVQIFRIKELCKLYCDEYVIGDITEISD